MEKGDKSKAFQQSHDEAAEWVVKVSNGLDASEEAAFEEWLARDTNNAERFEANQRIWKDVSLLKGLPDAQSLLGETNVGDKVDSDTRVNRMRWGHPLVWAAAACLVAGFVIIADRMSGTLEQDGLFTKRYAAASLERHFLPDGSLIEMRGGAELEVRYTAEERSVAMVSGEAFFSVAKDVERFFIVNAEGAAFRALGTAFAVGIGSDEINLIVTEGVVRVESRAPPNEGRRAVAAASLEGTELRARQSAVVERNVDLPTPVVNSLDETDIDAALSWKRETLDFEATPLADVVAEFNKRNRDQMVLENAALGRVEIDGTFRSDNLPAFVRLLELTAGIEARIDDAGRIVLHR